MFKDFFSFNGRIRRTEFGISLIIYYVLYVFIVIFTDRYKENRELLFAFVPMLWFHWAQGAKRCHDLGNSGWWQIIPFYVFWLLFQDGNPFENEYGESPKINLVYGAEDYQIPVEPIIYSNTAIDVTTDLIDDVLITDLAANQQQVVDDSNYVDADDNATSDNDDSGSYDDSDSSSSDDGMDSF
jgi:uncharacterized membrane protein YhaH (DUF805 family)